MDDLTFHYDASGPKTMMLQEFIEWDTYIRVPTIGRRWARAIRYDPAPMGMGGYNQDYDILPRHMRDKAEELSLRFNMALGYDMNALEFAVKDGKYYGIDLTNYTPDLDHKQPEGRALPLGGREDGGVRDREGQVGRAHAAAAELPGPHPGVTREDAAESLPRDLGSATGSRSAARRAS